MSEPEPNLPVPNPDPTPDRPPRPSRLRRFLLRHVPLALAGLMFLVALATVGIYPLDELRPVRRPGPQAPCRRA